MSQTYVIKVSASVQEQVCAKDRRVKKLVLTEIVPQDEQKEILRERLAERGWEETEGSEGQIFRREKDGVVETIDLKEMTVESCLEQERVLERERTIVVRGDRDLDNVDERRQQEQKELERAISITESEKASAEKAMQREIAGKLDEAEEERNTELNELVREVYSESLKRKASRLGSIQSIREGQEGEDYELVIRLTQ